MSTATQLTLVHHAPVLAVLADSRFAVPALPSAPGALGWLRSRVCRFSTGEVHRDRRGLATRELGLVAAITLRQRADARATALLSDVDGRESTGKRLAEIARAVPAEVLAEALGVTATVQGDVEIVAGAYHPGTAGGPAVDEAIARLVQACGGTWNDAGANRIGLLLQAFAATRDLIVNGVSATVRYRAGAPVPASVPAILAETLRHDPPVRLMRRVAVETVVLDGADIAAGCLVLLDIARANRDPAVFVDPDRFDPHRTQAGQTLTFGAGSRPCPGRDHAFALATGVVDAYRRHAALPGRDR